MNAEKKKQIVRFFRVLELIIQIRRVKGSN